MERVAFLWQSWLDKAACAGVTAIICSIICMFYFRSTQVIEQRSLVNPVSVRENIAAQKPPPRPPAIQAALDKSKTLLEAKDYDQVITLAEGVMALDAKESFAHLYLARAYLAKGDMPKSIRTYAKAVELNPDFVDRKSLDKIGPELKVLVRSAVEELKKDEITKQPDYNDTLRAFYYLQRRLAGGCE
ncbi:MAG: tetratricopeptide repeat protein [Candidatus Schekmanbacteria bacterium]|nr:tetratricopeptide repeat protein [Candidatus Schekmanbacteria bacterium]